MRLRTFSGSPFASGEATCQLRPASPADRLDRLFVALEIGDAPVEAVMDTGGAYLIVNPDIARLLGLRTQNAIGVECVIIRGIRCGGALHRIDVKITADAGDALTFQATAFVPHLGDEELWPLPSYLGLQGCLDRIRFAVDPVSERVYFGEAD